MSTFTLELTEKNNLHNKDLLQLEINVAEVINLKSELSAYQDLSQELKQKLGV